MSTANTSPRLPIRPLLPGQLIDGRPATLGVLGGGQLGRMFVQAAQSLGFDAVVLDPEANSPAGQVSHLAVQGAYDDPVSLDRLAAMAHAVTTEFENVPAQSMANLSARLPVAPQADAVAIAQDRVLEKALFTRCEKESHVGPAPHAVITQATDVDAAPASLLPGVLKTARLGYDGKGQARVNSREELRTAWHQLGQVPCVLEQMLPLQDECSVIIARGADGTVVHLPMQRNLHRGGILAMTEVFEGNVPRSLASHAVQATRHIAAALDYVGVLCVEFFVLTDGRLVINEMAPRPHNSGHYSVDACDLSQFDLQVRALAGLPLLQPRLHSPTIMLNLLGELWFGADGQPRELPWPQLLALPGCHLHLYGKREARAGRKMGHLTITAPTVDAVRATARQAAALLGMAPWWDDAAQAAQVLAETQAVQDE
jgi:5-(carboxyamino)imidazole ribonucleotide synthase